MSRPRGLPGKLWRHARLQADATLAGRQARLTLDRAVSKRHRVLVGPWLAEVGFELLYWIPFLHGLRTGAGVALPPMVVVSRGGTASWYGDACDTYVELHELFEPDDLIARQEARVRSHGGRKHTALDALDREAIQRAVDHLGGEKLEVLDPSLMFRRFRPVWMGRRPVRVVVDEARPRMIVPPDDRPPSLPERYIAVKVYTSETTPPEAQRRLAEIIGMLARDVAVVALTTGERYDDHLDTPLAGVPGVHLLPAVPAARNLAVQTAVIAGAEAFVATYGGPSYLGPLLGVPTIALYSRPQFAGVHLDVLRAWLSQLPSSGFSLMDLRHADHVLGGASRLDLRLL